MRKLVLCSGCERHVFVDERACPFCSTNSALLGRTAWRIGGVATVLATAAACGGELESRGVDEASVDGSGVVIDAARADSSDGGSNADVPVDAPNEADATALQDASVDAQEELDANDFYDVRIAPPYLLIMS